MRRLKELLDKGYEVVCFITHNIATESANPINVTDICTAKYIEEGRYSRYVLESRGCGFIRYWKGSQAYGYTFLELLEAHDIQFIEPTIEV